MKVGIVLGALIWLVIGLVWCLNSHAAAYIEIGIGKNGLLQENWQGRDSTGGFLGVGYAWRFDNIVVDLSYRHSSQITRGNGFDSRAEDSLDSIGLYGRYYFE